LKSELIFMNASDSSSGDDKIPGRFENPAWAKGLPESNIELASRRPAPRRQLRRATRGC
jgi:hypothetical protein